MAKKKRAINFKGFADDIKGGMTDSDLMGKYHLSHSQLDRVVEKLLDAGRIQLSDIEGRGSGFEATVQVAFTCPSCGALKFFDSTKCPECGYDDAPSGPPKRLGPPKPKKPKQKRTNKSDVEIKRESVAVEAAVEAAIAAKLDQPEPSVEPVEVATPESDVTKPVDEGTKAVPKAQRKTIGGVPRGETGPTLEQRTKATPETVKKPQVEKKMPPPKKTKAKIKKTAPKKAAVPKKGTGLGKKIVFLGTACLAFGLVVFAAVAYFIGIWPWAEATKKVAALKRPAIESRKPRVAATREDRTSVQLQTTDRGRDHTGTTTSEIVSAKPVPQPDRSATKPPTVQKPQQEIEPAGKPQPRKKVDTPSLATGMKTEQPQQAVMKPRDRPEPRESPPLHVPDKKEESPPAQVAKMQPPSAMKPESDRKAEDVSDKSDKGPAEPQVGAEKPSVRPSKEGDATGAAETPESSKTAVAGFRPMRPPVIPDVGDVSRGREARPTRPNEAEEAGAHKPRLDLGKALVTAVTEGDRGTAKDLLAAGADPNTVDPDGLTALMRASMVGNAELAELLLEHGAKVNVSDQEGNTPLMLAAGMGLLDLVRLLLENGADAELRNARGVTALGWAYSPTSELVSLKAQRSVIKLLKEYAKKRR